MGVAGGGLRSNCRVSGCGLLDAGLFRGLGGGGGLVSRIVRATGMRGAGGRVADFGGDEVPELVFVRFDGGGEDMLVKRSIS